MTQIFNILFIWPLVQIHGKLPANLTSGMKFSNQNIEGRVTYPFKCEKCQLDVQWTTIGFNLLKFTIIMKNVTKMKIGFAVNQYMMENTDVILLDSSTGIVKDCHIKK